MRTIVTDDPRGEVCLSVCLPVIAAERVEILFGLKIPDGSGNTVLSEDRDPP